MRSTEIESENNKQITPPAPATPPQKPERIHGHFVADENPEFSPHMLAELEDELARSRMREAFWISVIVHIAIVLLLFTSPKWMPDFHPVHLQRADELAKNNTTFLTLPQDAQKPRQKVQSDKLSDKDRVAETRHPEINRKTMDALRTRGDRTAPGNPSASRPQQPMPQPTPSGGVPLQATQPSNSQSAMNRLPQPRIQPAEPPRQNPFKMPGSAGDVIAEATRNQHVGQRGGGGAGYGLGPTDHRQQIGSFEILSDTQGVDFGPYLARMHPTVQMNWMNLEPESVRPPLLKHGRVVIRYFIMPDGKVTGMSIVSSSGDVALDRAAWGALTASSPFGPLPREYHGPYIELISGFYYNPTTGDLEQLQ